MNTNLEPLRRAIISEVMKIEGGYVDDPLDSGGKTKYGITAAVAARHGYVDVKALTKEQAYAIYEADYWRPLELDSIVTLHESLAAKLFDIGVNMGPGRAGEFLQRALNIMNNNGRHYPDVKVDGDVGANTLAALQAYADKRGDNGLTTLRNTINGLQAAFYVQLAERRPKDERFAYGWLDNRIDAGEPVNTSPPNFSEHPKHQEPEQPMSWTVGQDGSWTPNYAQPPVAQNAKPAFSKRLKGGVIMKLLNAIVPKGYGTYLTGVVMIVAGAAQLLGYDLSWLGAEFAGDPATLIGAGLGFIFTRRAIDSKE